MKKIAIFLTLILIIANFCSCKASNDPEEIIEVNYNPKILEYLLQMPYDYKLTDTQIEKGFLTVEKQDNGMAVMTIKRKDYEAYINELIASRKEIFNKYNDISETLITSVTYNDDLTEITVKVDKADYENNTYENGISPNLYILNVFRGCGTNASLYLAYSEGDFKQCNVKLIDAITGETLKSDTYPQTLFD